MFEFDNPLKNLLACLQNVFSHLKDLTFYDFVNRMFSFGNGIYNPHVGTFEQKRLRFHFLNKMKFHGQKRCIFYRRHHYFFLPMEDINHS